MSDLNDFFAKKDRKKKKAAAKSAQAAAAQAVKQPEIASENLPPPPPQKVPDDGWIELEDVRGSQVNTGGRTIVQLRREGEEKEANPDGNTNTEKFSGWAKTDAEPTDEEPTTAAQAPSSAFPTLADAAKVKKVAPTQSSSEPPTAARRPRFTLANREKLLEALTAGREPMKPTK